MSNLELWDKVQGTDPKYTKSFSKGGGFKGTSINPTYNNRKATEIFGSYGIGWGANIIKESFQEGAPLFLNGTMVCREITHILHIEFWYIQDGEKGAFPSFGQTAYVGQNKNGFFTDEEAPKKSLTDAITKALSMLGFSADIFLGMYDDVKYVNDKKEEYAPKVSKAPKVVTPQDTADRLIAKAKEFTEFKALKAWTDLQAVKDARDKLFNEDKELSEKVEAEINKLTETLP